jgi:hypothetical protein
MNYDEENKTLSTLAYFALMSIPEEQIIDSTS